MGVMYRPGEFVRQVMCLGAMSMFRRIILKPSLVLSISHYIQEYIHFLATSLMEYWYVLYMVCAVMVSCVSVMVLFITHVAGGEDRLAEGPTAV